MPKYVAPCKDKDRYFTPLWLINLARAVLGAIDLDPATEPAAQKRVQAATTFFRDGQLQPWPSGARVWLNPPYSHPLVAQFVGRALAHDGPALILVNMSTARWFDRLLQYPTCFLGRVSFDHLFLPTSQNRNGQVITYTGPDVKRFTEVFSPYGPIVEAKKMASKKPDQWWYVTGCGTMIRADKAQRLQDVAELCSTGDLFDGVTYPEARKRCHDCDAATFQPYLEEFNASQANEVPAISNPVDEASEHSKPKPRSTYGGSDTYIGDEPEFSAPEPKRPRPRPKPKGRPAPKPAPKPARKPAPYRKPAPTRRPVRKPPRTHPPKKTKRQAGAARSGGIPVDVGQTAPWGTSAGYVAPAEQRGKPSPDRLIAKVGGPSIFGWSALKSFLQCPRLGYYRHVLGWVPAGDANPEHEREDGKVYLSALWVGAVVHACVENYLCAGKDPEAGLRPIEQIKSTYPLLAAEVHRLFDFYLRGYMDDDLDLDIRFVEQELRYYFPPRQIGGKGTRRSLVVSSRLDSGWRRVLQGEAFAPPGELVADVTPHDLKTIGQMSAGATMGYRHDPQLLLGLLTYNEGYPVIGGLVAKETGAEVWGPAERFAVTLLGKAKEMDPQKHLQRNVYAIPRTAREHFADEIGDVLYDEIAPRLFHAKAQDPRTWPRRFLMCRCPMTNRNCAYIYACERGGSLKRPEDLFETNPDRIIDPQKLLLPKKRVSATRAARRVGA